LVFRWLQFQWFAGTGDAVTLRAILAQLKRG
jgi:hypothetical protein